MTLFPSPSTKTAHSYSVQSISVRNNGRPNCSLGESAGAATTPSSGFGKCRSRLCATDLAPEGDETPEGQVRRTRSFSQIKTTVVTIRTSR